MKLVFANPGGEDLAQVHFAVMQGGKPVVETDCDAPWVLMKLPAGQYSVAATVGARVGKASFTTSGSGQQTVTVTMPRRLAAGAAVTVSDKKKPAALSPAGSYPLLECRALGGLEVRRLGATRVGDDVERDLLAFGQGAHAGGFHRSGVHEHILAAAFRGDKAKAFGGIEEFHGSDSHNYFLP